MGGGGCLDILDDDKSSGFELGVQGLGFRVAGCLVSDQKSEG